MGLSFQHLIAVACGGAFGAVARYFMMIGVGHWFDYGSPVGTIAINILGSFVLGGFIEASTLAWSPSSEMRAFIVVGIIGSFTTFSTFSLDVYALWTRGDTFAAAGYVMGSVVFAVLAFFAGIVVFRALLS